MDLERIALRERIYGVQLRVQGHVLVPRSLVQNYLVKII